MVFELNCYKYRSIVYLHTCYVNPLQGMYKVSSILLQDLWSCATLMIFIKRRGSPSSAASAIYNILYLTSKWGPKRFCTRFLFKLLPSTNIMLMFPFFLSLICALSVWWEKKKCFLSALRQHMAAARARRTLRPIFFASDSKFKYGGACARAQILYVFVLFFYSLIFLCL